MEDPQHDEQEADQQPQKTGHEEERSTDDHAHGKTPARYSTREPAEEADYDAAVEEASRDSYPGSDSPAW